MKFEDKNAATPANEPKTDLRMELISEQKLTLSDQTTQPTLGRMAESVPLPPTPEPSSKQQSEVGEDAIIYTEGFENSPEVQKIRKNLADYLFYAFSFFSSLFLVAAAAISIYVRQLPDFGPLFLALAYYHCFQLPAGVLKLKRQFGNQGKIFRNSMALAHHLAFAGGLVGIFMYLGGWIPGSAMFYFTITNVLVQIIRYTCTNYSEELIVSLPFLNLVGAMCLMMIAIKLEAPANHAAWGFVLLWYYLFYYFSMIVLITLLTCGVLLIYFFVFDPNVFHDIEGVKINLAITLGSALFLLIVSVCAMASGVKMFMELGLVSPHPHAQSMPSLLFKASVFTAVYALVILGLVLWVRWFYQDTLIRKLFKFEGKTISLKTYMSNLKLQIRRVGANYFVKKGSMTREPELSVKAGDLNFGDNDKCMICCEATNCILLQPCKHFIFCETCVIDYMKQKSVCPMDKVKIDKALVMFHDSEKNEYYATKAIKVTDETPN